MGTGQSLPACGGLDAPHGCGAAADHLVRRSQTIADSLIRINVLDTRRMTVEQGLLLVLAVSLVCEVIASVRCSQGVSLVVAILVPLIASVSLYWLPNLGRFHDAELRNWFDLFLLVWFVPSAVVCTAVALFIGWLGRRLLQ
jgi:hypothetical protein